MCLASMPTVGPRVRHWSCPDSLLFLSGPLLSPDECVAATERPAPWEAEDIGGGEVTAWRCPRPSRWEERVLEWRQGRGERRKLRLALVAAARVPLKSPPTSTQIDNAADIEEIIESKYRYLK